MKLKWINPSAMLEDVFHPEGGNVEIHINTGYYTLKSYYKFKNPENFKKIEWQNPRFVPISNVESYAEQILQEGIDILCLSFFVWNYPFLVSLAKMIKHKNPNVIILAGGPTLNAHKDKDFFINNPDLDYVIYGDGEEPFADVLDHIIDGNDLNTVNLVTPNKKYPFRIFSDKTFWNSSIILDTKEDIKNDVLGLVNEGYSNRSIKFHWEIDRGCPYECSFCDWSSGLHHKVKRRSKFWKEELDFISTLPVTIRPISANYGIFAEDVEISQYAAENHMDFRPLYLAKMNKDRAWAIQKIHSKYNPHYGVSVSVQDLNKNILGNIDRPEIDWEEHKKYILDFRSEFPDHSMYFETMIGLPGQNVDTYKFMLKELESIKVGFVTGYMWILLPNTPAYESEYQEKFQMSFKEIWNISEIENDKIHKNITEEELQKLYDSNYPRLFKSTMVRSTYSADWKEVLKMVMLVSLYNGIKAKDPNIITADLFATQAFDEILETEANWIMEQYNRTNAFSVWDDELNNWFMIDRYYQKGHTVNRILNLLDK